MRVDVAAAGQGKGRGARNKDGEGRGGGGSTRRARVPGEGRSAACRRRQKAKSIILYKPVVTVACPIAALTPHVWRQWRRGQHKPSASQAKAEAKTTCETEAARLPGLLSRSPVCSGYRSRSQRNAREESPATWQVQVARRASVTTRAAAHVYLPEQRYQLRSDLALTSRRVAKMGTRWTSCVVSSLAGGFRASPIPISVEVPSARHPWTFPGGFVASASRRM